MEMFFHRSGDVVTLYGESMDLHRLGTLRITRASHVDLGDDGQWYADLASGPMGGPHLGPFKKRSQALAAEEAWLNEHLALKPAMLSNPVSYLRSHGKRVGITDADRCENR